MQAEALRKLVRLTDYLAAAQVFLKDNIFLERELRATDIKERLLGHWGTCPGINFVYANTNRLIITHPEKDFIFVVGPGHGFPAFQANLFVEGSLTNAYPAKITYTKGGVADIIRNFSTPYGYPSHLNPEAPGVILEGGELGYSLSVAAGAVLDNPRLVAMCLVGDGEAETGTLAASWHVNKFLNATKDGKVLPVLHLNGYKISGPTILGRMSDADLTKYFEGLGWKPFFIDAEKGDIYEQGIKVFDRAIQTANAMIILRTPKGMGAPEYIGETKVVGNCASHQVVFTDLHNDARQLKQLEDWLRSYKIDELTFFTQDGTLLLDADIADSIPEEGRRVGDSAYMHGTKREQLQLPPQIFGYAGDIEERGQMGEDEMRVTGKYLADVVRMNPETFRLFSPDETYSNHLQDIFSTTKRQWQMKIESWDKDIAKEGRVVEMLSEQVLFGMLWGYTLTGRYGFFATYEAFAQIAQSMTAQYIKFITVAKKVPFRKPVPGLNVILSSLLERQDHNGFSHQSPAYIASTLEHSSDMVNVYFPADRTLALEAVRLALTSSNIVNVLVTGKNMQRGWLTKAEAAQEAKDGALIWEFLSDEGEPDVVVATCGDYVTEEAVAGVTLFRELFPAVKLRFVNFFKLDMFAEKCDGVCKEDMYEQYLTTEAPIVFNFHGYPATLKKLLFEYNLADRIIINGYEEKGSTTSPFDMQARNGLSRFHLVKDIATLAANTEKISLDEMKHVHKEMNKKLEWEREYIIKYKIDPREITQW